MSDQHPAVVTIKALSSGTPQASIANVMTVISNPESTTLRTVIASEIKAANPSLGFDDTKHIAAVETGGSTNIKQLLDLPMSILLKQQVGIQDGVIHVTVDTPSPMKPPPRASSSKGHTAVNNKNRTNPFKDSNRQNFPPLEGFFRSSTPSPAQQQTNSSLSRASMHSHSSSLSSRVSTSICHDFSLDMSIAGQAALAHHRYQIEKYGIDGDKLNNNKYNNNDESISPLSEEKDWDHIMDSNSSPSNKSLALTDVNNTLYMSRISESQILSPSNLTEVSDSYFDKSVIDALKTPEKRGGEGEQPICGVTLSRGNDLDYSDDENSILDSPDASTHVANTSGLNGIFREALRMHNDLDKNASSRVANENESTVSTNVSMSRKGRKSLSVSFAVDESFAIEQRQSSSKKKLQRSGFGDTELDEFGDDFLLSPIGKEENKDVTFCVDSSFIAHQPSPSCSYVKNSCLETTVETPDVSPSRSGEMAPTSLVSGGRIQSTTLPLMLWPNTPSPEQNNPILRSKSLDECFRKKLQFDSPEQKGAVSEIGTFGMKASLSAKDKEFSSSIIRRNSSASSRDKHMGERLSRNDTHTTVPLEESSFVSQKENQSIPLHVHGGRVFGSDATSRLNSQTSTKHYINDPNSADTSVRSNASKNSSKSTNRKGAGLLGVSKLIEFSFEMLDKACSSRAGMPSKEDIGF